MTLEERATMAREQYEATQKEIINKCFFEKFQETPDTVKFTSYRTAEVKSGKITLVAQKFSKYCEDDNQEDKWYFLSSKDSWDEIKTLEELGFVY